MKKIFGFIFVIFTVITFSACTPSTGYDDLESLVQRIEDLEEENHNLKDRVKELEIQFFAESFKAVSLEEAYENGILNRNDIMHISYYLTGKVYEVADENADWNDKNNWVEREFYPEKELAEAAESVAEGIKLNYYYNNAEAFKDDSGKSYGTEVLHVKYLGQYGSAYVAIINSDLWGYGAVSVPVCIDGIIWEMSGAPINVYYIR